MRKDAAVAHLQTLYRHLSVVFEKNRGKPPSAQAGPRSRFETGPSQTRSKYINHSTEKVRKSRMGQGELC
jgi:hypothetical protein